jgi:hypothetical protein
MTLALLALLHAAPVEVSAAAVARSVRPEVSAGIGVGGAGYTFAGGRWGDALLMPYAVGRGLLGPVTLELEVNASVPLSGNGTTGTFMLIPRIGWAGQTWHVLVGVTLQISPGVPSPLQVLPSLRVRKNFTESVGVSAGLFDLHGLAPFHLSAELGAFDLGYVAPIGVTVGMRFRLPVANLAIHLRGLALRLYNSELALVTLGLGWGGEG